MPSDNRWTVSSQDVLYAVISARSGSESSDCTEMQQPSQKTPTPSSLSQLRHREASSAAELTPYKTPESESESFQNGEGI